VTWTADARQERDTIRRMCEEFDPTQAHAELRRECRRLGLPEGIVLAVFRRAEDWLIARLYWAGDVHARALAEHIRDSKRARRKRRRALPADARPGWPSDSTVARRLERIRELIRRAGYNAAPLAAWKRAKMIFFTDLPAEEPAEAVRLFAMLGLEPWG